MATVLSESFSATLKLFGDVRLRLHNANPFKDQLGSLTKWDDEFGRLRLWASNIGAHQKGQSSLDFRLRDASNIRDQIERLLNNLCDTLRDVQKLLDEVESTNDVNTSEVDSSEERPDIELEHIHQSIVICIDCLFQMSIIVRKPIRHDIIQAPLPPEILAIKPWYKDYVRSKFPKAPIQIVDRLVFTMMRRRHYLGYRERHRAKLGKGLDQTDDQLSNTILSNDLPPNNVDGVQSEAGTATSYASTMLMNGDIRMPPLPLEATGGKPFECPYCYIVISVKSLHPWHKHVYEDLRPYSCVVPDCSTPAVLYPSRRKWSQHLMEDHQEGWLCWDGQTRSNNTPRFPAQCILCRCEAGSDAQLISHLARHLQEVALFVLPRPEESPIESENDSNDIERTSVNSQGYGYDEETPQRDSRLTRASSNDTSSEDQVSDRYPSRGRSRIDSSRTSSPIGHYDSENQRRLRGIKELEKKEQEEEAQERWEEEQLLKAARKEEERKQEKEELKKAAFNAFQDNKGKAKAKEEEAFAKMSQELNEAEDCFDLSRPTYIKVNAKHMSVRTLEEYGLPWAWDEQVPQYIIIKRWIPEKDQDILFEHTRRLRERGWSPETKRRLHSSFI